MDAKIFGILALALLLVSPAAFATASPAASVTSPAADASLVKGGTYAISWYVTPAYQNSMRYIYAQHVSSGGTLLIDSSTTTLANGYASWTVPAAAPSGQYRIVVSVQPSSTNIIVAQSAPFTIVDSAPGNRAPTISGASGPSSLQVGQAGTWSITASDPDGGQLSYSIIWGDEAIVAPTTQSASAGQTATFTHIYYTAGNYQPAITVSDSQGASAQASLSVQVSGSAAQPDLMAQDIGFGYGLYDSNGNRGTAFSAIVKNIGTASSGYYVDDFYLDGTLTCSSGDLPPLAAGQTYNYPHCNRFVSPGQHTMKIVVRSNSDSNPTNNERTETFSIAAQPSGTPDLMVSSISASYSGGTINGQYVVSNTGTAASGGYQPYVYVDGVDISYYNYPYTGIPAGSSQAVAYITKPYALAAGTHTLKVKIVPFGTDAGAANNEKSATFSVTAPQNGAPSISMVSAPTSLQTGQQGTWTVTASDPENGQLSYSVVWGDEAAAPSTASVQQTATFTHVYYNAGTYTPLFTVTDSQGLSAQTSASVNVGAPAPSGSITVISPNGGESWQPGKTYTVGWSTSGIPSEYFGTYPTMQLIDSAGNVLQTIQSSRAFAGEEDDRFGQGFVTVDNSLVGRSFRVKVILGDSAGFSSGYVNGVSGIAVRSCTEGGTVTEDPTGSKEFGNLGLDTSAHPEIIRYKIQWFSGAWSDWYTPGVDDVDWKSNLDGSKRRVWGYFYDHTHMVEYCGSAPAPQGEVDVQIYAPSEVNEYETVEVSGTIAYKSDDRIVGPSPAKQEFMVVTSLSNSASLKGSSGQISLKASDDDWLNELVQSVRKPFTVDSQDEVAMPEQAAPSASSGSSGSVVSVPVEYKPYIDQQKVDYITLAPGQSTKVTAYFTARNAGTQAAKIEVYKLQSSGNRELVASDSARIKVVVKEKPPEPPSYGTITLSPGWNMVSVPLNAYVDMAEVAKECNSRAYGWRLTESGYVKETQLSPGKGYWVRSFGSCTYKINGSPSTGSSQRLFPGWNLIHAAGWSTPISQATSDCKITSGPWYYQTSQEEYVYSSSLEPSRAYWLRVDGYCTLNTAKQLEEVPPAPPEGSGTGSGSVQVVNVDLAGAHYRGDPGGRIALVEFGDFEDPFTSRADASLDAVVSNYPGTKVMFRHFPLSFHSNANTAAQASECAASQGRFWDMYEVMLANQDSLSNVKTLARKIGLDGDKFDDCLDSGVYLYTVSSQVEQGNKIGLSGTPSFLIFYNGAADVSHLSGLEKAAASLRTLGTDAKVVKVGNAGYGVLFAGAVPYNNFAEVMSAFN